MSKMETKNIICTCCPMGCHMTVTIEDGKVLSVEGNTCKRGSKYAVDEITCKKRTLTTTVKTDKGYLLSVRTYGSIPFDSIPEAMKILNSLTLKTPVKIGDIVCENICNSGINVIATKNVD